MTHQMIQIVFEFSDCNYLIARHSTFGCGDQTLNCDRKRERTNGQITGCKVYKDNVIKILKGKVKVRYRNSADLLLQAD